MCSDVERENLPWFIVGPPAEGPKRAVPHCEVLTAEHGGDIAGATDAASREGFEKKKAGWKTGR